MQPRVFDEGMKRLVSVFGEVTTAKSAIYWDACKDLPDGGFVLAVREEIIYWLAAAVLTFVVTY